jgi:hypothetical protein
MIWHYCRCKFGIVCFQLKRRSETSELATYLTSTWSLQYSSLTMFITFPPHHADNIPISRFECCGQGNHFLVGGLRPNARIDKVMMSHHVECAAVHHCFNRWSDLYVSSWTLSGVSVVTRSEGKDLGKDRTDIFYRENQTECGTEERPESGINWSIKFYYNMSSKESLIKSYSVASNPSSMVGGTTTCMQWSFQKCMWPAGQIWKNPWFDS